MKKPSKFLSLLLIVAIIMGLLPALNVAAVNPYLPLWEHLPDGEPKVFEDPDNPGKYRAYIFGSHDVRYGSYCGPDIRAWSAPVEDLTNWRDEGSVFKYYINGQWDVFYAPDVVEVRRRDGTKEYYLYPHSRGSNRIAMVCKSDRPEGPYTPINMTADGTRTVSGSIMGFDPAVWVEYVTDPSDPDYEIGFRAYGYWGYAGSNEKSWACELDQNTMYSVRPGTQAIQYFMPCSSSYGNINDPAGTTYPYIYPDEDITTFNFFEASSIRKIGNKYIMLYSGYSGPDYGLGSTNSALRYCYGDSPLGPWRSGGVLVDSRAPVLNQNGTALTTSNTAHNTHGSLLEINGNWYCFYHRPPRGYGYARQPMVAPVKITWDEKPVAEGGKVVIRAFDPYSEDNTWIAKDTRGYEYTGAEVTSEGFEVFGLDPYKYYSAGYACYFSNPNTLQDSFDIWDNNMAITNVQNGHIIGYKYFGFGGLDSELASQFGLKPFEGTKSGNNTKFNLFLTPRTTDAFKINIWMDGPWANDTWKGIKIGEINVPAGSEQVVTKASVDVSEFVDNLDKKHAIFLVAEGGSGNLFDLTGLGFSSDTKDIEYVAPPKVDIFVEGIPLTLPTTPVRSTNSNGICDYDLYELSYQYPYYSNKPLNVTASSSDENIGITITQPAAPNGVAEVKFDKDGVVKTYRINLSVNTDVLTTAYIDNITVDGESIPNFVKNRFKYTIEVPEGTTTVPDIQAVSSDEDVEITVVNELEAIPGVKVFRSYNKETNVETTYRVGVGCKPVSTDFKEGESAALAKGWYFNNRNENAVIGEAGLTIITEKGAFLSPENQPKNVFMLPAAGDWVVQFQMKFDPPLTESNQQAGLIIYDDENNHTRFVYECSTSGSNNGLRVYTVVDGSEGQSNLSSFPSLDSFSFQVAKEGDRYHFSYLEDGTWITSLTYTADYALPQIGLYASNGDTDAEPVSVTCEKFSVYELTDLYPRLTSISIDGMPLAKFDPEVFLYHVAVDEDDTNIPVISATCDNPIYDISYRQLAYPTGVAYVTVSSPAGETTYLINFNTAPISDYFADGTMNSNWTVLRENKDTYSIEKGSGLRLPTQRYDIYSTGAAWENVFVQSAVGDWEVVAKVFYPHVPTANYQQAMLLVWEDEDNYIRANCQQSALRYEPGIETNGSFSSTGSGNATAADDGTVTLYHRIKREGNTYTISVSQDGENFTQLGNPITADYMYPQIGFFATQNSDNTPMNTYIEYLTVTSINGVQQKSYQEMLQDAADNVMKYVSESIPAELSSDIEFAIPHGYSVSVESSDPNVIANDGKVTLPTEADKDVMLTITISDGVRTAVSEPISVTVKAVQAEPEVILTGSDNVQPASSFTVGISLNTVTQSVYAEDITLIYDPEVFEYVATTGADEYISILRSEPSETGELRIVAANIGGVNGSNAPILNVGFKVKSGVQDTSSTISATKASLGIMPESIALQAGLSSKTITVGKTSTVDRSGLLAAISAAQSLFDSAVVGTENGCYWQSDKNIFQAAIDAANVVYEDSSASQSEVNDAADALNAAKVTFEASVITDSTGDLNNSSTIDIGDLAIAAYYYGMDSSSENWAIAKIADINKDNKVDIEDLAFIATRILDN